MAETNQNNQPAQPGAVIGPSGTQPSMPVAAPEPVPVANPILQTPLPTPLAPAPELPASNNIPVEGSYAWTAAEFIAHHKTPQWFVGFGAVSVIIIAAVYLITKDITAVLVLLVGAVAVGIFAGRIPSDQQFQIDSEGFSIGQRRFMFAQFKSFSIIHEGALSSVQFLPLKRFAPYTTIYYGPENEDQVLDKVENALPYVEHNGDAIDRLLRRVRF